MSNVTGPFPETKIPQLEMWYGQPLLLVLQMHPMLKLHPVGGSWKGRIPIDYRSRVTGRLFEGGPRLVGSTWEECNLRVEGDYYPGRRSTD